MSHIARSIKEGAENDLGGVGKGKEGADGRNDKQDDLASATNRGVFKRSEHAFLGYKAQKRWYRGHRGHADDYRAKCPRHLIPQWSEAANIARTGLVVDDANKHKQRGLK